MAAELLNGRVPLDYELAAIEHGRRCDRERDLELLAGVLTADPVPVHEGRPVTDIVWEFLVTPRARRGLPDPDADRAVTLRAAHAQAKACRLMRRPVPARTALLDREYQRWRKRVQRGRAPEVPSAA